MATALALSRTQDAGDDAAPSASTGVPRHLLMYPDIGKGYQWRGMVPFILIHLLSLGAIWSGVTWQSVVVCVALYWIRMFGTTSTYHRYFSHRTFKTSRFMQFCLAFLAMTSSQKGVLWWASHHRHHHKYSDTEFDIHSPKQKGFWYSHFLWIYDHTSGTDFDGIKDFARFPELVFLDKYWLLPPIVLGVAVFLIWGWAGLFIGYFLSTAILWHGTFTINSLSHVFGNRRYVTTDTSKNNWLLAIITMGEGWHNNHHHYCSSTRQGFFWWEFDMTYYILKVMSWCGLVWDLREPPASLLEVGKVGGAPVAIPAEMVIPVEPASAA